MEGDILLENNVAEYVPELQIFASSNIEEVRCIVSDSAEVSVSADFVISDVQSEGARFSSVEGAVAETSLISVVVLVSVGVPVFAEYAEVINRNNEVCAPDAVKAVSSLCFVAGEVTAPSQQSGRDQRVLFIHRHDIARHADNTAPRTVQSCRVKQFKFPHFSQIRIG